MRFWLLAVAALLAPVLAAAQPVRVELDNGRVVRGELVEERANGLVLEADGVRTLLPAARIAGWSIADADADPAPPPDAIEEAERRLAQGRFAEAYALAVRARDEGDPRGEPLLAQAAARWDNALRSAAPGALHEIHRRLQQLEVRPADLANTRERANLHFLVGSHHLRRDGFVMAQEHFGRAHALHPDLAGLAPPLARLARRPGAANAPIKAMLRGILRDAPWAVEVDADFIEALFAGGWDGPLDEAVALAGAIPLDHASTELVRQLPALYRAAIESGVGPAPRELWERLLAAAPDTNPEEYIALMLEEGHDLADLHPVYGRWAMRHGNAYQRAFALEMQRRLGPDEAARREAQAALEALLDSEAARLEALVERYRREGRFAEAHHHSLHLMLVDGADGTRARLVQDLSGTVRCRTCAGARRIHCLDCRGRGTRIQIRTVECPSCRGGGWIDLPAVREWTDTREGPAPGPDARRSQYTETRRQMECTRCRGVGLARVVARVQCATCSGTTERPCPTCDGQGAVDLDESRHAVLHADDIAIPEWGWEHVRTPRVEALLDAYRLRGPRERVLVPMPMLPESYRSGGAS